MGCCCEIRTTRKQPTPDHFLLGLSSSSKCPPWGPDDIISAAEHAFAREERDMILVPKVLRRPHVAGPCASRSRRWCAFTVVVALLLSVSTSIDRGAELVTYPWVLNTLTH